MTDQGHRENVGFSEVHYVVPPWGLIHKFLILPTREHQKWADIMAFVEHYKKILVQPDFSVLDFIIHAYLYRQENVDAFSIFVIQQTFLFINMMNDPL